MARTRRRRGAGTALVVFLLLGAMVAVGLYAGDRYALGRAEREAAGQLQQQLGTPQPPSVDIAGWPFLTQALTRDLSSVRVVADDVGTVTTGGGAAAVPVRRTDLVLTDVSTPDWYRTLNARQVEGTALIEYDNLGALSSVPLRYAGGGKMSVELTTGAFGLDVRSTVTGTPRLDVADQTITLADPAVTVGSVDLPTATAEALIRSVLKPIPVRGLPFGLRLSSISAEDDGLHAGLVGEDVTFTR